MSTNGNGDTIIAMPCNKWFPKFSKHFANETLHLQVTQVKKAESATGGGTLFMVSGIFRVHVSRFSPSLPRGLTQILVRLWSFIPHCRVCITNDALHRRFKCFLCDDLLGSRAGHGPPLSQLSGRPQTPSCSSRIIIPILGQ